MSSPTPANKSGYWTNDSAKEMNSHLSKEQRTPTVDIRAQFDHSAYFFAFIL